MCFSFTGSQAPSHSLWFSFDLFVNAKGPWAGLGSFLRLAGRVCAWSLPRFPCGPTVTNAIRMLITPKCLSPAPTPPPTSRPTYPFSLLISPRGCVIAMLKFILKLAYLKQTLGFLKPLLLFLPIKVSGTIIHPVTQVIRSQSCLIPLSS